MELPGKVRLKHAQLLEWVCKRGACHESL